VSQPSTLVELEDRVLTLISRLVERPKEEIPLDADFASLGLESLDTLNILFAVEDELQVSLPDGQVDGIQTVKKLLEVLAGELAL